MFRMTLVGTCELLPSILTSSIVRPRNSGSRMPIPSVEERFGSPDGRVSCAAAGRASISDVHAMASSTQQAARARRGVGCALRDGSTRCLDPQKTAGGAGSLQRLIRILRRELRQCSGAEFVVK